MKSCWVGVPGGRHHAHSLSHPFVWDLRRSEHKQKSELSNLRRWAPCSSILSGGSSHVSDSWLHETLTCNCQIWKSRQMCTTAPRGWGKQSMMCRRRHIIALTPWWTFHYNLQKHVIIQKLLILGARQRTESGMAEGRNAGHSSWAAGQIRAKEAGWSVVEQRAVGGRRWRTNGQVWWLLNKIFEGKSMH